MIPGILLIMDDDADNSQAVHILSKYHFANSLLKLRNGREANKFFAQVNSQANETRVESPELIILSLAPGVQPEVAKASRRDRIAEVPLIVVVESKEEEEAIRKLSLPLSYIINKPLGFFKLLEAMQKLGMYWLALKAPLRPPLP